MYRYQVNYDGGIMELWAHNTEHAAELFYRIKQTHLELISIWRIIR